MPTMIVLLGVVTKNSILLVEYAIMGIKQRGLERGAALLEACHLRARPIIITTVAMVAAMVSIALGCDANASFLRPMTIAVIGGILTSTALNLLIVRVMFTLFDDIERFVRGAFGRPLEKGSPAT
jgi:multidrug efflux pump subunit AcrB